MTAAAELEAKAALKAWEGDATPAPGRCRDCRWWLRLHREHRGIGDCRRFPPVTSWGHLPDEAAPRFLTAYPATAGADWCGEFRAKE